MQVEDARRRHKGREPRLHLGELNGLGLLLRLYCSGMGTMLLLEIRCC